MLYAMATSYFTREIYLGGDDFTTAIAKRLGVEAHQAELLKRDGCAVVDRLAQSILERVRQQMAPFVAATPLGNDDFSGRQTIRTGGLVARSPAAREIVMHPTAVGAVGELLAVLEVRPGRRLQPLRVLSVAPSG